MDDSEFVKKIRSDLMKFLKKWEAHRKITPKEYPKRLSSYEEWVFQFQYYQDINLLLGVPPK